MSQLGYLEALSDKELRAKCIEYGLPNIPVTGTSRKLLIRHLLEKLGEPLEKKTKPRTSSTQKVMQSPPSAKAKAHRDDLSPSSSINNYIQEQVLGSRYGAVDGLQKITPPKPRPAVLLSKTDMVTTNFDSNQFVPTQEKLQHRNINVGYDPSFNRSTSIPRSDRSASLTRSEVITTSYMQELAPSTASWEEVEDDDEDEEMDDDLEPEEDAIHHSTAYDNRRPQSNVDVGTSKKYYPSKDNTEELISDSTAYTSNYNSSFDDSPSTNRLYPSLPRIEHTDTHQPMFVTQRKTYHNTQTPKSTAYTEQISQDESDYYNNLPSSYIKDTIMPSSRYYEPDYYSKSDSFNKHANPLNERPNFVGRGTSDLLDDINGLDSGFRGGVEEKVYSSKFARKLEHKTNHSSPPRSRSTIHQAKASNNSLMEQATDLEQKYHLKQAFAIILCFILAVFVYVFFLQ